MAIEEVSPVNEGEDRDRAILESGDKESDVNDHVASDDEEESEEEEESTDEDESTDEEPEESEEEETDESDESEDDDDESDDDKLEADAENLYQQLKTRDPKLLKEIPELRATIFREQEYAKHFPTIEDAKSAVDAVETLTSYENDLRAGNSTNLIEALAKTDKKSLENFAAGFIPSILKHSRDLHFSIVAPEIKQLLRAAARSTDERMSQAAINIHHYVFDNGNLEAEVGIKPIAESEQELALTKREKEFEKKQHDTFFGELRESVEKSVKREIARPLVKSGISPLLQQKLIDEVYIRLDAAVGKNARHMGNIRNLAQKASRDGYKSNWKDSIHSAQLSCAKGLIPKLRKEVLAEAKLTGVKLASKVDKIRIPSSNASRPSGKKDPKKHDWSADNAERKYLD